MVRFSRGLAMLGGISNRDRHQRLVTASVRWNGEWPRLANLASLHPMPKPDRRGYLDPRITSVAEVVSHELRHGEALLMTSGVRGRRYLAFPLNAYLDRLLDPESDRDPTTKGKGVLDACFESVDMGVSRLRNSV